jgi:hypothetical protein
MIQWLLSHFRSLLESDSHDYVAKFFKDKFTTMEMVAEDLADGDALLEVVARPHRKLLVKALVDDGQLSPEAAVAVKLLVRIRNTASV